MRNDYNNAQIRERRYLVDAYVLHTFDFYWRLSHAQNHYTVEFFFPRKFTFLESHHSNNTEINIALYIIDAPHYQNSINKMMIIA